MKRVEPRRKRRGATTASERDAAERNQVMADDVVSELTIEELREFLQADALDVPVDPAFKERLRRKLWELVQEQLRRRRGDA